MVEIKGNMIRNNALIPVGYKTHLYRTYKALPQATCHRRIFQGHNVTSDIFLLFLPYTYTFVHSFS